MIRCDDTGFGKIKIYQDTESFCYGVDAVLLADCGARRIKSKKYAKVADFCSGTGIVPLILSHKCSGLGLNIDAYEVQEKAFNLLEKNISENCLSEIICAYNMDIMDIINFPERFSDKKVDLITMNPPYNRKESTIGNISEEKYISRHETTARLLDFMKAAQIILEPKGELIIIHQPSRLVDLMSFGRELNLEPKEIQFVAPRKNSVPNLVLIRFLKGGGKELKMLPTINVYGEDGYYSSEINEIYERVASEKRSSSSLRRAKNAEFLAREKTN